MAAESTDVCPLEQTQAAEEGATARVLTDAAVAQYRDQGYYFPLPVLLAGEVSRLRAKLEAFEAGQGHPIEGVQRSKSHLLFKWLDDLMRDARILDAVERVRQTL